MGSEWRLARQKAEIKERQELSGPESTKSLFEQLEEQRKLKIEMEVEEYRSSMCVLAT